MRSGGGGRPCCQLTSASGVNHAGIEMRHPETDLFRSQRHRSVPRFVSHRGYTPLAPENSLPGFAYAGLLGQWAIETDVHLTRDGVLVCCHDEAVDAMYDGTGAIADMTWAELSRLRLRSGSRLDCFAEEELRMPLFSEYLQICRAFGSVPFIELKVPVGERVMDAVRQSGFAESQVIVSTFHLSWLTQTREAAPDVFLHHIFSDEPSMHRLAELGNAGISWNFRDPADLTRAQVAGVRELGLRMCLRAADSWGAVARMQDLGLDYVPTNTMHAANPLSSSMAMAG